MLTRVIKGMDKTDDEIPGGATLRIRVRKQVEDKIKELALAEGYLKNNGDPNVSEYVRKIIDDRINPIIDEERITTIVRKVLRETIDQKNQTGN